MRAPQAKHNIFLEYHKNECSSKIGNFYRHMSQSVSMIKVLSDFQFGKRQTIPAKKRNIYDRFWTVHHPTSDTVKLLETCILTARTAR